MTLTKPMACEEPKRRKKTRTQENIGSRRPREERGEGGSGQQWRLGSKTRSRWKMPFGLSEVEGDLWL